MKNFVSVNAKYYKNSNASGELGHVNRLFKENVNSFSEYTKFNFGSSNNLFEEYKKIHAEREKIGKKAQKNANTFIDAVMVFSEDQFSHLEEKYGHEKLEKAMKKIMNDYMQEMKKTYGFQPVGFEFHLDEGHGKNSLKRNIHAHVVFYNYDFETKSSPLRKLKKNDFSVWQDIAHEHFKKAGFTRGLPKEHTNKKHKEKSDFITQKVDDLKNELKEVKKEVLTLKNEKLEIFEDMKKSEENHKNTLDLLLNKFLLSITEYVKNLMTKNTVEMKKDIDNLSHVINEVSLISNETAQELREKTNDISNKFNSKNKL
jgi:hypothetical protein|tara:strand:- start:625 stop:1569 length:945 start_codon:yes stop_codon:yes gene_type:complete